MDTPASRTVGTGTMVPAKMIAVVRAATAAEGRTIVHGLIRAGVPAVELTMTVPDAVAIIGEFAGLAGGSALRSGTALGAGTVLDPRDCAACADAGATFIVSPVTDLDVLEEAHRRGVAYIGGALTPTEVLASMRAGSDAVKIFPVGAVGGPGYLRALREPLPALRAVVSGGIAAAQAGAYREAGAYAVCLGGALIDREAAGRGDVEAVAAGARRVMDEMLSEALLLFPNELEWLVSARMPAQTTIARPGPNSAERIPAVAAKSWVAALCVP